MGKGKVCAQVAHAVIGAYLQIEEEAKFDERSSARLRAWESSGTPKIVVKAQTEREML
jgi:peptidyl-tRNA hydrolase